ncbi:MAG: hypothetical protein R2712_12410 [Vicinamibacterales bacterium]
MEFAAKGGVQAVVDSMRVLIDAQGKRGRSLEDITAALATGMASALRTRTANLGMDVIEMDRATRRVSMHAERGAFRSRFAVRFGAKATDEGAAGERDDVVRRAFNSPFWPFVLCSTSVGQEGLDFHHYCHAVGTGTSANPWTWSSARAVSTVTRTTPCDETSPPEPRRSAAADIPTRGGACSGTRSREG